MPNVQIQGRAAFGAPPSNAELVDPEQLTRVAYLFAFNGVHVTHNLRELRPLSTEFLQYETT